MYLLFTICGRAGSKGLVDKMLRELAGKPLVGYVTSLIDLYRKAHPEHVVRVALNTDSEPLTNVVRTLVPDVIVVPRRPELAGDTVGKVEVVRDTLLQVEHMLGQAPDAVVDLDITAPIRTLGDLEAAMDAFAAAKDADVVMSVVPSRRNPYFNMVERRDDGRVYKVVPDRFTARQDAPPVFDITSAIYVYAPTFLRTAEFLLDGRCVAVVMEDTLVLDIDSGEDLDWLEYLWPELQRRRPGLKDIHDNA